LGQIVIRIGPVAAQCIEPVRNGADCRIATIIQAVIQVRVGLCIRTNVQALAPAKLAEEVEDEVIRATHGGAPVAFSWSTCESASRLQEFPAIHAHSGAGRTASANDGFARAGNRATAFSMYLRRRDWICSRLKTAGTLTSRLTQKWPASSGSRVTLTSTAKRSGKCASMSSSCPQSSCSLSCRRSNANTPSAIFGSTDDAGTVIGLPA